MRPSLNIHLFSTTTILRDAMKIYLSLPEYTPFSTTVCDPPRIYFSFSEYTLLSKNIILCDAPRMYPSLPEYIPPPLTTICNTHRIHPPYHNIPTFSTTIYATLPESTPSSQNIPPFSTTIILCDAPRIYLPPRIYLHLLNNYMRYSQTLPLPPRIYSSFPQICDHPRIYPSLQQF